MRNLFTILLVILANSLMYAQEGTKIRGHVVDGNQKIIESATISLLKIKDSTSIKFTVADQAGNFVFENVPYGNYMISVSAIGHVKAFSESFLLNQENSSIQIKTIELVPEAKSMGAVTVTSRKPLIEIKADKTIVNVDASVTNVGATALEVLEKSPGVTVDKDGNISLKGKQGVMVMMDGRPAYLSGNDLVNYLKSLPASAIDQIEIMTNPSSKYDAAGNSGIINIKSKKNKQAGFNGNVTLAYGQGIYWRTNNSINMNYKNGKFNVFVNGGWNKNKNYHELIIQRKFKDSSGNINSIFQQVTEMKNSNEFDNLKVGVDYYVSKNTTVGIVANGFMNPNEFVSNSTIHFNHPNNSVDSIQNAKNDILGHWKNGSLNANFRHQFDSIGTELTTDLDYVSYRSTSNQNLMTTSYDPVMIKTGLNQLKSISPVNVDIYSAKADFVHPMKKEAKIEAGLKLSSVHTTNEAHYFNLDGSGNESIDYTKTNNFDYKENINAAYLNFSKHYKKFDAQLGLRYELTKYTGHEYGNPTQKDSIFNNSYGSLFPTIFVTYAANKDNQFSLSYGRRIDRPDYESLNPFLFFLDPYTYEAGNPFTKPQFTNNIELSHTYKSFLTTTLNYSHTTDFLTETFNQGQKSMGENPNATIVRKGNLGIRDNAGIAISAQVHVTKWWMAMLYGNYNYEKFNGSINNGKEQVNVSASNLLFNVNNQFNFDKGWSAELSGFYRTKGVEGQIMIGPMGQASAGVGKQVLKNKATIKFNIRDMFHTMHPQGDINFGNTLAHFENINDSRVATISFTYRFGKPIKDQRQRKVGGADDEQNRVKVGGNN